MYLFGSVLSPPPPPPPPKKKKEEEEKKEQLACDHLWLFQVFVRVII